jgi:mannose-6-phosphate isomerase
MGESFVINPDEPHAYIQGELVEAMVNSDNVVRGGLTPKYKDTKTLCEVSK